MDNGYQVCINQQGNTKKIYRLVAEIKLDGSAPVMAPPSSLGLNFGDMRRLLSQALSAIDGKKDEDMPVEKQSDWFYIK